MPSFLHQHDALAVTSEPAPLYNLRRGRVLRRLETGAVVVLLDGQDAACRCAISCLVAPEPGDLVLLAGNDAEAYILAVLERPGAAPAVLTASTPSETMVLAAQKLVLRAADELEMTAPRTQIKGGRLTIAVDMLSFVAKWFDPDFGTLAKLGGKD